MASGVYTGVFGSFRLVGDEGDFSVDSVSAIEWTPVRQDTQSAPAIVIAHLAPVPDLWLRRPTSVAPSRAVVVAADCRPAGRTSGSRWRAPPADRPHRQFCP